MKRLFIAINLPDVVRQELARIQPARVNGLRPTSPEQWHVTLHFIGDAEPDRLLEPLSRVAAPPFTLQIAGVGKFAQRDRSAVLWAGVVVSEPLRELHAAVGRLLEQQGFAVERRPYQPHITLARCRPECPRPVIQEFLERHSGFAAPEVTVSAFSLMSSRFAGGGSVYTHERDYPLR